MADEIKNKTAVLLGSGGSLFDSMADMFQSRGMDAICLGNEILSDYHACARSAAAVFDKADVSCIIYSVLVGKEELPARLQDMDPIEWKRFKQFAFGNSFNVNRTFLLHMAENGGGRYLTVGSIAGVVPAWGEEVNGAVSASAFMVMKSNVLELSSRGITANAAALGLIEGDAGIIVLNDGVTLRRHIPGDGALPLEEAGEAVVRLAAECSPRTAGNIFRIDAGFSCGFMRDW